MPEIKYKIGCITDLKEEEKPKSKIHPQEEIKTKGMFNCPSCNYLVSDTDEYCPDCGLYY